jgi:Type IV secretion-system coupling protein DNA-binding domain
VIYGHLAEVMLSQPSTSIYLKTKEPKAGEWVSNGIGKVEIERMKETRFDGSRSGRNFSLDRQIEPVVMESEISGLPDRHAFMKHENYVTGFSFPYLDVVADKLAFDPRLLENDKLTFDPRNLRGSAGAPVPSPKRPRNEEPSAFADPGKPLEPAEEPTIEAATSTATPTPTAVPSEMATPEPKKTGRVKPPALHIGG